MDKHTQFSWKKKKIGEHLLVYNLINNWNKHTSNRKKTEKAFKDPSENVFTLSCLLSCTYHSHVNLLISLSPSINRNRLRAAIWLTKKVGQFLHPIPKKKLNYLNVALSFGILKLVLPSLQLIFKRSWT